MKNYRNHNEDQPKIAEPKKRGRAADLFKERYGDRFMVLKRHHAVEVLNHVTLANKERGGMVTISRIQAHLLAKFDQVFKKATIHYCLTKRLHLKFSDSGRPKIVFTPARKRSALIFCRDYDLALKLEAAGTHVIVYMDESYCHVNHRCSRTWWKKGNTAVRGRGKGSLLIILHTITKSVWDRS